MNTCSSTFLHEPHCLRVVRGVRVKKVCNLLPRLVSHNPSQAYLVWITFSISSILGFMVSSSARTSDISANVSKLSSSLHVSMTFSRAAKLTIPNASFLHSKPFTCMFGIITQVLLSLSVWVVARIEWLHAVQMTKPQQTTHWRTGFRWYINTWFGLNGTV